MELGTLNLLFFPWIEFPILILRRIFVLTQAVGIRMCNSDGIYIYLKWSAAIYFGFLIVDSVGRIENSSGCEQAAVDTVWPCVFITSTNCTPGRTVELGKLQESDDFWVFAAVFFRCCSHRCFSDFYTICFLHNRGYDFEYHYCFFWL